MERRTFLGTVLAGINGIIAGVLAFPGLGFLLAPLRRSGRSRDFVPVVTLDAVSADRPMRAAILADRWDAYIHYPPGPIGQVWLLRDDPSDADPKVRCLSSVCPHLGCAIDYVPRRGVFQCPCHASEFDSAGRRRAGPSPRDMDELQCRITDADESGRRWVEVKYEEFHAGLPEKLRITRWRPREPVGPIPNPRSTVDNREWA